MENSNNISIKTINDLLKCNFYIPSYQRGYRWTEQQVKDLLNDINEFSPKAIPNSDEKTWYCLQPIVVKQKEENEWDVIDGQQRLTTIYLILYYLNQRYTEEGRTKLFELEYETRVGSANYLKNDLGKNEKDNKNIDYFHISVAYQTIKNWFVDNKVEESFEHKFLNSTKVIWYETPEKNDSENDDNSIDIFTRINSGKIPLTNAELIKALFLNRSNFTGQDEEKIRLKQLEIASEWDRIEFALQDDSFWYFINKNENSIATRIEFIFNLMYDISGKDLGNDEYSTFRFFNDKFKENSKYEVENNWKEIKKYFQTLEEWYNDRELYHKIGYLITVGTDIKNILHEKQEKSKREFTNWIEKEIKDILSKNAIDELEYGVNNSQLIRVLLLHNIITTLNSEDTSLRFPFNKYKEKKNGGWSLEHIHAQNSELITKFDDFKEWIKAIDKNELTDEIKKLVDQIDQNSPQNDIAKLVSDISVLFGELEVHFIENMALLSKKDNSKLNNGLFPVKRERIIELEKNGAFIPIATKKVFQKYYEGCTKQISKWEHTDRKAYINDIVNTLEKYLPQTTTVKNEQ